MFFKLVPVVPRFRLCRNRFPPLSLATVCLDYYTHHRDYCWEHLFFLLTPFFSYGKNLKVLTTQEGIEPRHLDWQHPALTTTPLRWSIYYFFYLTLSFRSGKNLKVLTSQAGIDLNLLDWQHCVLTTTPPRLLQTAINFFLLKNPFLSLWKKPKSADFTGRNRSQRLRLATLRFNHYTKVVINERLYFSST